MEIIKQKLRLRRCFYQTIRKICLEKKANHTSTIINFKCDPNLSFPSAELAYDASFEDKIDIYIRGLGLIGVDSCLPSYFNDQLIRDDKSSKSFIQFLDIFHNIIYSTLFHIWMVNNPDIHVEFTYENYLKIFKYLAPSLNVEKYGLALVPVFIDSNSTLSGINKIVNWLLPNMQIKIIPSQEAWHQVSSSYGLGSNQLCLGDNSVLGNKVLTGSHSFSIEIGPISFESLSLLHSKIASLKILLNNYLDKFTNFKVIAFIYFDNNWLILGEKELNIGKNVYIGGRTVQISVPLS